MATSPGDTLISIPKELKERLKQAAKRDGRTMRGLIDHMLTLYEKGLLK